MATKRRFRRILSDAAILLSFGFNGVCAAQGVLPENPEGEAKIVYSKHKDVVIEQSDEEKKNTDEKIFACYPPGTFAFYCFESVEGDYYRIKYPISGRLKKSDFYTSKEFKAFDTDKILTSDDDWLKYLVAADYFQQKYASEALDILNRIDSEFTKSTEFRVLRAMVKTDLRYYESALLDVAPIFNEQKDGGKARPSDIRLTKAYALVELNKHQEGLEELDLFANEIGGITSDWIFLNARCHYKIGNYEKALNSLEPEKLNLSSNKTEFLYWLKSRCLVLKERPEYDTALEKLDSEERLKSNWGTESGLDAVFIYSTFALFRCNPN